MPWVQYIGRRALAGDVLGPNLVSNGHFTSATTGWTASNATLSVRPNGVMRVTNSTTSTGYAFQAVTTETGAVYRIDYDGTLGTASAFRVYASTTTGAGGALDYRNHTASASGSFYFLATGTTTYVLLLNNDTTSGDYTDFDNIKVRKVQARGHATDIEHVVNGAMNADSTWTKGTGWTIGSGVASSDGTQTAVSNLVQQTGSNDLYGVRLGKSYSTDFTVSGYSAGTVRLLFGGAGSGSGTARSADGTYTQTLVGDWTSSADKGIYIQANADFVGSVDNVSVTLAADNTWSLDFDIADMQPGRSQMANSVQTLDGSTDTQYWSSKKTLVVQTDILAYGEWQFLEEFADNAVDGQTVTFDPFGTESQPKAPGSYILTDYSLTRIIGADTTERRQYQLQFREA